MSTASESAAAEPWVHAELVYLSGALQAQKRSLQVKASELARREDALKRQEDALRSMLAQEEARLLMAARQPIAEDDEAEMEREREAREAREERRWLEAQERERLDDLIREEEGHRNTIEGLKAEIADMSGESARLKKQVAKQQQRAAMAVAAAAAIPPPLPRVASIAAPRARTPPAAAAEPSSSSSSSVAPSATNNNHHSEQKLREVHVVLLGSCKCVPRHI